ncbi:MAG: hypothetical protein Q8Q31_05595 [Nanoarchaeota archaeon]|nr:hypothetical protein [Nanoarchaeota archaeon]
MKGVIIIELALYFIIILSISLLYKKSNNLREFSISNRALLAPAIAAGLVTTHYGGGFILGGAELGYKYGLYGLVYAGSSALGVLLLGIFISKRIFKLNEKKELRTIPALLFHSFKDRKLSNLAAGLSIVSMVIIAAGQLFAVMCLLSAMGLPAVPFTFLVTLVISIITSKGLSAVVRMSKLNISIVSITVFIVFLIAVGSSPNIESQNHNLVYPSFLGLLGLSLPVILYTLIGQDFHQKLFSAKNYQTAKNGSIAAAIILLVAGFFPVYIGMKSSSLFDISPSEAMPYFIISNVPLLFKGFIIAAILTAVIGSAQALISAAASHLAEDFLKPTKRFKDQGIRKYSSTFAFMAPFVALVIALFAKELIGILILAYTLYIAGMFVPVMTSLYLKAPQRINGRMFYISIIGLTTALIFETHLIKSVIHPLIISIMLSVFVLLAISNKGAKKGI